MYDISVIVLCASGKNSPGGYIKAFESFAKDNLDVEWGTTPKKGNTCLLLCDVVTRTPEDVRWVLQNLGLEGKNMSIVIRLSMKL